MLYDDALSLGWVDGGGAAASARGKKDATAAAVERATHDGALAGRAAEARLGPRACDDMLRWLCSLDVADQLLHADPLVQDVLPRGCERLRDLPGGATLLQVRERLAKRAYADASAFVDDARAVSATVVGAAAQKLPKTWSASPGKGGAKRDDGVATALHAAQVFSAAFESRWARLYGAPGREPRWVPSRMSFVAPRARSRRPFGRVVEGKFWRTSGLDRGRRDVAATRLHGLSTSRGRGAAATRLHGLSTSRGRGAAATRSRGIH